VNLFSYYFICRGLGKTIQTVAFLHQLRYMSATNIRGPFLIIAPLSLVDQWQNEIATWSPDMNCVLLHGSVTARENIINNEFYFQEPFITKQEVTALRRANVCKFHILLTTYEVATKEIRNLCRVPWSVMVIDEAHKLKNTSSKLFTTLSTIESDHRILLTGTPLQNKTEELWSLLNFADPKRFADMRDFMNKFGDLKSAQQVASLHEILKPYLLRRIKEDVERSLPPKEETIVEVALTGLQKRFYRAIYERNTAFLFKGCKASNQPSLMNVMMELRKCCNHPFLVRGVEERVFTELTAEEKLDHDIVHKKLIESSGKLVLLDKLLPRLFKEGHKVLIFSQMVRVLNLLEDFLKYKGYSFERLDGSSKSSDRKDAVERFCKPSMNRFIMLLSTKAGGLGLNLTAVSVSCSSLLFF
jgi:SNF2 family DNA or RNA helicase